MLLIIWFCLILLGILFPKSKAVTALMLLFMVVVIGFRTEGGDYIIYQNEYKWSVYQSASDIHYVGYLYLEQFAHQVGIKFEQWLMIVGTASIVLTYLGLRKLTNNVNAVLALYFIYPFTHEAIQVRTFLANSVIIFALPLILLDDETDKKKTISRSVIFYLLAALACTFHFEAAIYVGMILLMLFLPKKYNKITIFSFSIILFALIEFNILPKIISGFNTRIAYWISGKTGLGIVIPIAITLVIWYIAQVAGKHCIRLGNIKEKKYYQKLVRLCDFIILLIPMFCYDITFNRLWRVFLIIIYIMVARAFPNKLSNRTRSNIVILVAILLLALVIYENEFSLMIGIFKNNGIFKSFSII